MNDVLFFGGRNFDDQKSVERALTELPGIIGTANFCVVHGGARGADSLSGIAAARKGLPVIIVPANWAYYRNSAGPIRNTWMLDHCIPVYAVGFPGGAGSADMRRQCEKRGIMVWLPLGK